VLNRVRKIGCCCKDGMVNSVRKIGCCCRDVVLNSVRKTGCCKDCMGIVLGTEGVVANAEWEMVLGKEGVVVET